MPARVIEVIHWQTRRNATGVIQVEFTASSWAVRRVPAYKEVAARRGERRQGAGP